MWKFISHVTILNITVPIVFNSNSSFSLGKLGSLVSTFLEHFIIMNIDFVSQTKLAKRPLTTDGIQARIQDLVKGGPASEIESCQHSDAELCKQSKLYAAGVQSPLKGPGSFWVFNDQICILPHSRDSFSLIFDIYFNIRS